MSDRTSIDIDGIRSGYFVNDDRAAEDDPTLLLIHGLGGDYLQWPPHVRRIRGIRTIAIDLPGHGESGGIAAQHVQGYVGWLNSFIDELELAPLIIAGNSLGGAVALAYSRTYSVDGLAIVACGNSFELPVGLADEIDADREAAANRLVDASAGSQSTDEMRTALQHSLTECDAETLRRDLQAAMAYRADESLGTLRIPIALVSGSDDQIAPPDSVQRLHDLLPTSEWSMIQDASHILLWENEEELSAAIQSLIERVTMRTP